MNCSLLKTKSLTELILFSLISKRSGTQQVQCMSLAIHASLLKACTRVRTACYQLYPILFSEATGGAFATDRINSASNYSVQLKGKCSTKNAHQHLTVEERTKLGLGHCLAYSYNSEASLLSLCYLVIPYAQVQAVNLMLQRDEEL